MNYVKDISLFVSGAALGSALTYILIKNKYAKLAQEEIDSVKSVFAKKETEAKEKKANEITLSATVQRVYSDYSGETTDIYGGAGSDNQDDCIFQNNEKEPIVIPDKKEKPYIIPPEEFGEFEDYEQISLNFNQDDMLLTDEFGELVDNADEIVGKDFYYHFGEYEDDSVFVRNDKLRCDYEILLDN